MERPKTEADDNDSQPSYRDTDRGAADGRLRPDTRPRRDGDGPGDGEAPDLQRDRVDTGMTREELAERMREFFRDMAARKGWK
jgi:hypothetical protein